MNILPNLRSKVDRGNQLSSHGIKKLSRGELIPHKVQRETALKRANTEGLKMSTSCRYRQGVEKLAANLNRLAKEDNCAKFRKVIQTSIVKELHNFNSDKNWSTQWNENTSEEILRGEWV